MLKSVKTKFFATLCATVMTLGVVAPSFNNPVSAASPKTIYVDVEKNVTGQAPILQPKAIQASDTETIADVTKKAAGDSNVDVQPSYYGPYVAAFKDKTGPFDYKFKNTLDTITNGVVYKTNLAGQPIINDADWLREKEYTGISGWMFTVNNESTYNGGSFYKGETKVSDLKDGAVIRWEFSMASGADLGLNNAYLPTADANGYYDWNSAKPVAPFFTRVNKTELIKAMANYNNKADEAYTSALKILYDLDNFSEEDVNDAAADLKQK